MKYLNAFNRFNESVDFSSIRDILLDITDDGFKFNAIYQLPNLPPSKNKNAFGLPEIPNRMDVSVTITKKELFTYNDIEDTINRLSGYMESEGYKLMAFRNCLGDWRSVVDKGKCFFGIDIIYTSSRDQMGLFSVFGQQHTS